MEAAPRTLRVYTTADGRAPFSEWLGSLRDQRARDLVRVRLDLLQLGILGDCRALGRGISELRIDFGPGYRVYFGQEGWSIVLL